MQSQSLKNGLPLRFAVPPASKGSLPHRIRFSTARNFKPSGKEQEYYSVLGLTPDSTADEIKAKYRALQKRHHPDISGDQEVSTLVNEAYRTLMDPILKANYDRHLSEHRVRHKGELSRIPIEEPGLVGPIREGDVLTTEIVKVEDHSDFAKEGRKLLVWLREWAKTFMFASDLPLPMPVQCDDIEAGVRLAVISMRYNVIQSVGELLFTVAPTKKMDAWTVEVRRVSILRPGPIPGEKRLMEAFSDAMKDKSTPDKKKGSMFELSGMAAAAFAQLMPALIPLPLGQTEGAAYEGYHLKHTEDADE